MCTSVFGGYAVCSTAVCTGSHNIPKAYTFEHLKVTKGSTEPVLIHLRWFLKSGEKEEQEINL